MKGALQSQVV